MTEREKAVAYLTMLATEWPSDKFKSRMAERGLIITPEIERLGKAMLAGAASEIGIGKHIMWAKEELGQ